MPLLIYAAVRLARAIGSALTLVTHPRLVRRLPWGYIGTRVRSDRRTGFAAACLGFSTLVLVAGAVVPDAVAVALLVACISIVVSAVMKERPH